MIKVEFLEHRPPLLESVMTQSFGEQRSPELHHRERSLLVVIDMQEKLLPLIPVADRTIANCQKLISAAELFAIPSTATEQYPRGLGPTVASLAVHFPERPEKTRFSSAACLNWGFAHERADGRTQAVLCGIEAHVCVLQTALDLVAHGYQVTVVADAVASRGKLDWKIALRRLSDSGVTLATTESVLFEWCETSSDPLFKRISQLVKEN